MSRDLQILVVCHCILARPVLLALAMQNSYPGDSTTSNSRNTPNFWTVCTTWRMPQSRYRTIHHMNVLIPYQQVAIFQLALDIQMGTTWLNEGAVCDGMPQTTGCIPPILFLTKTILCRLHTERRHPKNNCPSTGHFEGNNAPFVLLL